MENIKVNQRSSLIDVDKVSSSAPAKAPANTGVVKAATPRTDAFEKKSLATTPSVGRLAGSLWTTVTKNLNVGGVSLSLESHLAQLEEFGKLPVDVLNQVYQGEVAQA